MVKSRSIGAEQPAPDKHVFGSPFRGCNYKRLPESKHGLLLLTRTAPDPTTNKPVPLGAFEITGEHKIGTEEVQYCIQGPDRPMLFPNKEEFAAMGITSKIVWW